MQTHERRGALICIYLPSGGPDLFGTRGENSRWQSASPPINICSPNPVPGKEINKIMESKNKIQKRFDFYNQLALIIPLKSQTQVFSQEIKTKSAFTWSKTHINIQRTRHDFRCAYTQHDVPGPLQASYDVRTRSTAPRDLTSGYVLNHTLWKWLLLLISEQIRNVLNEIQWKWPCRGIRKVLWVSFLNV